jgi:hypothetical protein
MIAGLLLFAMIFAIAPISHLAPFASLPSKELINIGLFFALLGFGVAFAKLIPATPRPMDTTFHLLALIVTLVLILVPEVAGALRHLRSRCPAGSIGFPNLWKVSERIDWGFHRGDLRVAGNS